MNLKQVGGLVVVILGVMALLFASYAKIRVNEVKKSISTGKSILPNNPIGKSIDKSLQKQVSQYDSKIMWGFVGGSVLVVVGAGIMVISRKKK